jgi:hypothetical protein
MWLTEKWNLATFPITVANKNFNLAGALLSLRGVISSPTKTPVE